MEKNAKYKELFIWGICFVVVAYMMTKLLDEYEMLLEGIGVLVDMALPFLIAFLIAYALNPLVNMLQKKLGLRRSRSIMIVYLMIFVLIGISSSFVMPKVYNSIVEIAKQVPDYIKQISEWVATLEINFENIDGELFNKMYNELVVMLPQIGEMISSSVGSLVGTVVSVFKSTFNVFIAFVVCFYILLEKDKFCTYTQKLTYIVGGKKYGQHMVDIARTLHQNIGKYLIGKSMDSIFVGLCAIVGLGMMHAKYALLLGIVFGITNMVPYLGPIVGTIIAVGINLFYNPTVAFMALVYLIIVQQVETLIIDPKVVGKQLGLSPFFTLFAVSIGGKLFGIPGMILGVPIVAILKKYGTVWINRKYDAITQE